MSDELKPCPFCGERPRLTLRPDNAEGTAYFAAVACYCGGYSACAHKMATATNADEAEGKVRAAWNRRAAAQPPAAMPAAELEALAREAGMQRDGDNWYSVGPTKYDEHDVSTADLARFAALVLAQAQSVPATGAQPDPMDWPLPCDVTVGHGTMRKGVRLGTLVARMKVLYHMATGRNADDVAGLTIQQREAMGAAFLTELGASPTPPQPVEPTP